MEYQISKGIIDSYFQKLQKSIQSDVVIIGGGPSGLVAAYYLAKAGKQVVLFERKLAPGGGMWGGAMMFNEIVVQSDALPLLNEFNIAFNPLICGLYSLDSVQATASLIYHASTAGAIILNCISMEDVVLHDGKVTGIVINWTPVKREGMHVDPLMVMARCVVDATGHDCEVVRTLERKNNIVLNTTTGKVVGEMSMNVEVAEQTTLENTKEIYPGLYVCGMAANGVSGSFRMGPIFGGMLLSGKKIFDLIMRNHF